MVLGSAVSLVVIGFLERRAPRFSSFFGPAQHCVVFRPHQQFAVRLHHRQQPDQHVWLQPVDGPGCPVAGLHFDQRGRPGQLHRESWNLSFRSQNLRRRLRVACCVGAAHPPVVPAKACTFLAAVGIPTRRQLSCADSYFPFGAVQCGRQHWRRQLHSRQQRHPGHLSWWVSGSEHIWSVTVCAHCISPLAPCIVCRAPVTICIVQGSSCSLCRLLGMVHLAQRRHLRQHVLQMCRPHTGLRLPVGGYHKCSGNTAPGQQLRRRLQLLLEGVLTSFRRGAAVQNVACTTHRTTIAHTIPPKSMLAGGVWGPASGPPGAPAPCSVPGECEVFAPDAQSKWSCLQGRNCDGNGGHDWCPIPIKKVGMP